MTLANWSRVGVSPRGRPATLKRGLRSGRRVVAAMFWQVLLLAALGSALVHHQPNHPEDDDDTVVIDAAVERESRSVADTDIMDLLVQEDPREERQFVGWPGVLPVGPCFTSKGVLGRCTSFRQCYPYFKLPELTNWETWILGMYDTCSYFTSSGRQMFGVCCTNPGTVRPTQPPRPTLPPATENPEPPAGVPNPNPIPPNWPPPIPTHPPDHTIPPLPTHPPSPGWPGLPGIIDSSTTTTTTTEAPSPPPPPVVPPVPAPVPWPPQPWPPQPIIPTQPTPKPPPAKPPAPAPWPPTHPPIPTHPPLPTHPPSPPAPTPSPVVTTESSPGIIADASCGAKNGYQEQERIVGGHDAEEGEWPWIAALFNGGRQFCGGSLIDSTHILTAAHCVAHMSSWDVARLTVRLGDHNIRINTEVRHIEKKVKRVVRHRGFDSRTLYNDVAILTLDSPVTFTNKIRPICLPSGSSLYAGLTATVIGWGSLREGGQQPAVLQEVNIPIWQNNECKAKYGNAAPGGIVEHFLCAGGPGHDSCSGDSGGPLMINQGRWTQVGIVSWGIGCGKGQYPGVYTRVTHFMSWITKNLK